MTEFTMDRLRENLESLKMKNTLFPYNFKSALTARKAGISPTTVSAAVYGKAVSREEAQAIADVISQMS